MATVIAATTAAGPATTSAVGVATTSTAIARERSSVKNSVVAATVSTSGSQTPARRSKSRRTGTVAALDFSKKFYYSPQHRIGARPAHLNFEQPVQRDGPGKDRASGRHILDRRDSPVMADWSTAARPSNTVPSTAILSPGRTSISSPGKRLFGSTRSSSPLRHLTACRARKRADSVDGGPSAE